MNRHELIQRLRISGSRLARLRVEGLTHRQADRYSTRCGFYPWQIWPSWLAHAPHWDEEHPSVVFHRKSA